MPDKALGDVARVVMGQSPPGARCNTERHGLPLLNGPTEFGARHPEPRQWTTDPRRVCRKRAALLCVRGSTTGRTNRADQPYALGRGIAALETDDPLDQEFIYYSLIAQMGKLLERTTGSVFPNLSRDDIGTLAVPWPPYPDRRSVAEVLGALDDKIEANGRAGGLLGALAGVIFAQMFEGDDDRPWIRVGTAAEVVDCLHSKKPDYVSGGSRYLVLDDIRKDGRLDVVPNFTIGPSDYAEWIRRIEVSSGDCIITNVGRVGAVAQIPKGTKAAIGRNMTAIRVHEKRMQAYMIEALRSKSVFKEIAAKTDQGTVLSALNVRSIPELVLPFGSAGTCERFQTVAGPLHDFQDALLCENAALSELRNVLLPKLLSGELRAREAEARAEEAV
jgi:type I restriction enzyme S subunit